MGGRNGTLDSVDQMLQSSKEAPECGTWICMPCFPFRYLVLPKVLFVDPKMEAPVQSAINPLQEELDSEFGRVES